MRQPPSLADVLTKLAASGIAVPPGRVGLDTYGDTPELSHELVALIREGPKRAGTGLLWALEHEGERLPEVGDVDWDFFGRECARLGRAPTADPVRSRERILLSSILASLGFQA